MAYRNYRKKASTTTEKTSTKRTTRKRTYSADNDSSSKKEKSEYAEYVGKIIYPYISSKLDVVRGCFASVEGDLMSDSKWTTLAEIVMELTNAEGMEGNKDKILKLPKRKKYTITEKVWEMERRKYINAWISRYDDGGFDKVHCANLIYSHLYLFISETSKK